MGLLFFVKWNMVAIFPMLYQLGLWSLLPRNAQWRKFIGADFTMEFPFSILREIE